MNPRAAFNLGLRLLGFHLVLMAIASIPSTAQWWMMYSDFLSWNLSARGLGVWQIFLIADPVLRLLLGIGLILSGPWIARRAYPTDSPPGEVGGLTAQVLLRIGMCLVGIYALLWAIFPASQFISQALSKSDGIEARWDALKWAQLASGILYFASGIALIAGARPISEFLLRPGPPATPDSSEPADPGQP